ncbi:MAG: L,D-transpeptidase [Pleurocapsa minor GSE-CHR-MK-17-07R]|jgi:hypothetical protein|nr:L,D-transpeptidase [Pleurocapsa minor GSE-CHR-MK 17-07R]
MKTVQRRLTAVFITAIALSGVSMAAAQTTTDVEFLYDNDHTVGYLACSDILETGFIPDADCARVMASQPEPSVVEVPLDLQTLNSYSYWRVVTEGEASVFEVPDGNVLRTIEPGFNFVIATDINSNPGWIGVQGGGWMRESDIQYVPASYFAGVQVLNALEQPFGWVMFDLYPASVPGGQQDVDTQRLMRKYDRFNVFASIEDTAGVTWYMIGENEWVEQRWVAVAKPIERPENVTGRWIAVDLYEQTLIAYENDTPVYATLVATGLPQTDTPPGLYEVWARLPRDPMSGAAGSPRSYALQDVPWVMYFNDGISLHGTYWHEGFGYRRSRGCVNLSISDARYLYDWVGANPVNEEGVPETYVYVYSSGIYGQFGISQG